MGHWYSAVACRLSEARGGEGACKSRGLRNTRAKYHGMTARGPLTSDRVGVRPFREI